MIAYMDFSLDQMKSTASSYDKLELAPFSHNMENEIHNYKYNWRRYGGN